MFYEGMKFATSMKVLFKLKEKYEHTTLQETYKIFDNASIDTMYDILLVSYNLGEGKDLSMDQFLDELEDKDFGFIKLMDLFEKFVNKLMFNGLSEQEIESRKNLLMKLAEKK